MRVMLRLVSLGVCLVSLAAFGKDRVDEAREEAGPRISARVVPGPLVGRAAATCLVTLLAWRTSAMSDARWAQLVAAHEVEILALQQRIDATA